MKSTDAAWLAGIVDGEGSVFISKYAQNKTILTYMAVLAVVNTSELMVKRCKELGGGCCFGPIGRGKPGVWKPAYRWCVKGKQSVAVLKAILPFLVCKGEQAKIALTVQGEMRLGAAPHQMGRTANTAVEMARKETFRLASKALNHRGSSPIDPAELEALEAVRGMSL